MSWVDLAIVIVLAMATLGGLAQGFFRSICSLLGLVIGLELAAWNYGRVAALVRPIVPVEAVDNFIGFLVIALLVMAVANLVGGIVSDTVRKMGLGCVDKLGGAVVGFVQGVLLVVLVIVVTVAFFPKEEWLADARLPRMFLGACHLSTNMTPGDLGKKMQSGLEQMERQSPEWMHPGNDTPQ
jgi:membrane protein required for colicin V production